MVVVLQPLGGQGSDLVDAVEDVAVEDFRAIRPVEAFDVGILSGLALLDELQLDAVGCGPGRQSAADQFRSVVHAQPLRRTTHFDEFSQRTYHPLGRQAGIDLDSQRLTVEVIEHIERAEAPTAPQGIGHEVDRPGVMRPCRHQEGLPDPVWQTLAAPASEVELEVAVHPPQTGLAAGAGSNLGVAQQPEAIPAVVFHVRFDRGDHRAIVTHYRSVVPQGPGDPSHLACPPLRHPVRLTHVRDQRQLLRRG